MIDWLKNRVQQELRESAEAAEQPPLEAKPPIVIKDRDQARNHPALIPQEEQVVVIDPLGAERLANTVAEAFALERNQIDAMRLWVRVDLPILLQKVAHGGVVLIRVVPDYSSGERTTGMEWWVHNRHLRYSVTRALWQHGFKLTERGKRHHGDPEHIELKARSNDDRCKTWDQYVNAREDLKG